MQIKNVVVVGGCGHVGLPLGLMLSDKGNCTVNLLDIDQLKVDSVNAKRAPFIELGIDILIDRVMGRTAFATTDKNCLRDADAVITVVGTPVDKHLNPTVSELKKNIDEILELMKPGALLILRSTVYPGVTHLVHQHIKSRGANIKLAFCPERIAEGKALEELVALPQIVSGVDQIAVDAASELFGRLTDKILVLEPLEAELAKLFTNSWRYLNFSISNQFYMLAQEWGLDFYRIYDAVKFEYPRMASFARPGFAAGPCLLKDTLQLSAFANNNFFLGHSAMLVNEGLPNFLVNSLSDLPLNECTVGILGMAFKANSDDKRDSLSYKLRNLLEVRAKSVLCTDPYVEDPSLVDLQTVLDQSDVLILGAPHDIYKSLDLSHKNRVVDCWGFLRTEVTAPADLGSKERMGEKV